MGADMDGVEEKIQEVAQKHDFVLECLDANYLGDGILYGELFRENFVRNNATTEWLVWDGHRWLMDELYQYISGVEQVAQVYAAQIPVLEERRDEARQNGQDQIASILEARLGKIKKRIQRLRSPSGMDGCIRCAWQSIHDKLSITGNELDQDPWLLGCPNGVLDLRTGEFREGRRDDYITKCVGTEWTGWDATCPTIDRFLWDIVEDQDVVDFIWRWIGYCLTGSQRFQKFLFLAGDGRNGKGVLTELILALLGTYGGPIQAEMLLDQGRMRSSASHSADLMELKGMRFVLASESDEGRRFSASRVKWLTGGDTLTGRRPNAARYESFAPTHKAIISSNFPPHASGTDRAFWDRMIYLLFPYTFVYSPTRDNEKPRDDELLSKLKKELPGMLRRSIEGCMEVFADGLQVPASSIEQKQAYRRDEDVLQDFVDDCILESPGNHVRAADMYRAFHEWWNEYKGSKPPSDTWMGRHLGKKIQKQRGRSVKYMDVVLISQ
jgi:putative DNA primase/helicase